MAQKEDISEKLAKQFYEAAQPMLDVLEIAADKQWAFARQVVARAQALSPDDTDEGLTETFEIVKNIELETFKKAADNKVSAILGPAVLAAAKEASAEEKISAKPPASGKMS